ncbi:hypothetical protein [Aquibium microcysteis]|uniref:hypothetical protein n=1 Tax=Aquibium microcysteis TaxID=675281 RepID=UPI00165D005F|nr:hypothetical protein [Aquibium microcysteis]
MAAFDKSGGRAGGQLNGRARRQRDRGRFTIDRLMAILSRLDQKIEITVRMGPRARNLDPPPH